MSAPFFPEVLEQERQNDFKILSREEYNHIWLGEYNDSVENAIIKAEWFDACIDAHKTLGFEPRGIIASAFDPSDVGDDPAASATRHGSVLIDLQEADYKDANDNCDWGCDIAIGHGADHFTWDCDGLGAALSRQVNDNFEGKNTRIVQFKGSTKVDFPKKIFRSIVNPKTSIKDQKTNEDALKNKRAQYYEKLQFRVYNTFRAVTKDEYIDPDTMISFDSSLALLPNLRSELCKIPQKPNGNGLFDLYTKKEMKTKFKLPSPNLSDCCMMGMRIPPQIINPALVRRPAPRKVICFSRRAYG